MSGNRRPTGGMSHEESVELLGSFGGRCRQRRLALGLTVREVAEAIAMSSPSVSNIERNAQGPVNILTLTGLRRTLDCSADWLLDPSFYVTTPEVPPPLVLRAGDALPRCIGYVTTEREIPSVLRQAAHLLETEWYTKQLKTGETNILPP